MPVAQDRDLAIKDKSKNFVIFHILWRIVQMPSLHAPHNSFKCKSAFLQFAIFGAVLMILALSVGDAKSPREVIIAPLQVDKRYQMLIENQ